jgi:hypothetical protein
MDPHPRLSGIALENSAGRVGQALRESLAQRARHASSQFHHQHGHDAAPRQAFLRWTARIISNSSPFGSVAPEIL